MYRWWRCYRSGCNIQDDDGDGLVDCDDPDCAADPACLIVGTEICSDGDNDSDEILTVPILIVLLRPAGRYTDSIFECDCTDGFDNNGSNGVDCADPLV